MQIKVIVLRLHSDPQTPLQSLHRVTLPRLWRAVRSGTPRRLTVYWRGWTSDDLSGLCIYTAPWEEPHNNISVIIKQIPWSELFRSVPEHRWFLFSHSCRMTILHKVSDTRHVPVWICLLHFFLLNFFLNNLARMIWEIMARLIFLGGQKVP